MSLCSPPTSIYYNWGRKNTESRNEAFTLTLLIINTLEFDFVLTLIHKL